MESNVETKDVFTKSMFNSCKNVFNLIKEGREKDAKEMFPLEYHLVNKYLYQNLTDLVKVINNRLELV